MTYEWFIASREYRALRKQRRAALTARIASLGVGIGVAALVIVLSVMNGFSGLLWERVLSLSPHVVLRSPAGDAFEIEPGIVRSVGTVPGVVGVTEFIETQGYLMRRPEGGGAMHAGVVVNGMTSAGLRATSDIGSYLWAGAVDFADRVSESGRTGPGIVVGSTLADRIGAAIGSEVRLGLPPAVIGGGRVPRLRRYVVSGIFRTEYPEFDSGTVFVGLGAVQEDFEGPGKVSGVRVRVADPVSADVVRDRIEAEIGGSLTVTAWMEEHQNLYASIQLEKWGFYLGLTLIVVVAGFNIISILSMKVSERRRDIGILKAMGATEKSIGRVFSLTGLRIGLAGVLLGTLLGFILCWVQQTFEPLKLPGDIYIVSALPVEMHLFDFTLISISAVVLCYLFTLIPAREAAGLDPVDAIRD